ncbi:MAG TPA: hypothetical protein VI864_05785 [Candidatus Bathyarchaeia archaeon]|nr:hypothetical protein [Candidatus Bathyarchaeia archaeon]
MAYLRKEKETVEIAYSLSRVWAAIPKALTSLEWILEQIDNTAHHVKVKTKAGAMSWSSVLLIDAVPVDEKTTRVSVSAETPVTAITAIVDFGRTRQRIDLFFAALAKQLAT